MIKNALIGLGVSFTTAFAFFSLESIGGSSTRSSPSLTLPVALGVLTFVALQMLSGNRKETRVEGSTRQAALNASAPPGQALLFIYREGFVGKAVGWNVTLDGATLAQLKSPRFTCTAIRPGRHTLAVNLGLKGFAGTQNTPSLTSVEAQAGEVLVYAVRSKMGALKTTLYFAKEPDPRATLQRLANIPMVASELQSSSAAA
jgi:hypothetical protein